MTETSFKVPNRCCYLLYVTLRQTRCFQANHCLQQPSMAKPRATMIKLPSVVLIRVSRSRNEFETPMQICSTFGPRRFQAIPSSQPHLPPRPVSDLLSSLPKLKFPWPMKPKVQSVSAEQFRNGSRRPCLLRSSRCSRECAAAELRQS